jgi:hypothetical protein
VVLDTEQKVTFDAESRKPRKQALAKSESLSDPIMAQSDPTTVLPRLRKIIVVLARHERDFLMLSEDESEYGTGSRSPEPLA